MKLLKPMRIQTLWALATAVTSIPLNASDTTLYTTAGNVAPRDCPVSKPSLQDLGLTISYGGPVQKGLSPRFAKRDSETSFAPECNAASGGTPPLSSDCTSVANTLLASSAQNLLLAPGQCMLASSGTCAATACNMDPCSTVSVDVAEWAAAIQTIRSHCVGFGAAAGDFYQGEPGVQVSVGMTGVGVGVGEYEKPVCG